MIIDCTGTDENIEEIRKALDALKPRSEVKVGTAHGGEGAFAFDQVWPDGQISRSRWIIKVGQSLETETGEVLSATLTAE